MQGSWQHCLAEGPKPNFKTNPNSISYEVSQNRIHATVKVKEQWPAWVGNGGGVVRKEMYGHTKMFQNNNVTNHSCKFQNIKGLP
jgi:hypothetical protein